MTVQDSAPTLAHVPRQAGPVEPPAAPAHVPPLLGRDRPLTADERAFALGLTALVLVLGTIVVVGLLVGQYVWS